MAMQSTTVPKAQQANPRLSAPALIQQHFRTPGSRKDANLTETESKSPYDRKSKIVKRTGFDASKTKWDGRLDSFPPVEAALRAYCMISQMGYIVRPQFLNEYERYYGKVTVIQFYEQYRDDDQQSLEQINISFDQFLYDRSALYGAIVAVSRYQVATAIVHRYANTNDGIAAFIALLTKYGGSFRVRRMKATSVLQTPYTPQYQGGLVQYLMDFEEAYSKYDELERKLAVEECQHPVYDTDAQRREKLFKQLFYEPSMRETIRHCRITFHTFDDVVQMSSRPSA